MSSYKIVNRYKNVNGQPSKPKAICLEWTHLQLCCRCDIHYQYCAHTKVVVYRLPCSRWGLMLTAYDFGGVELVLQELAEFADVHSCLVHGGLVLRHIT